MTKFTDKIHNWLFGHDISEHVPNKMDASYRRLHDPTWSGYEGPGSEVYEANRMHRRLSYLNDQVRPYAIAALVLIIMAVVVLVVWRFVL